MCVEVKHGQAVVPVLLLLVQLEENDQRIHMASN